MPQRLYKILLILGIAVMLTAIPFFWLTFKAETNLEVDFLDVGQGDSILIKAPAGQNILIDGGPDNTVIKRLSENLPWWDRTIDLMILSHPHDDHVTGLIDVIKRYKVKKILYTGVMHDVPGYLAWQDLVREKKISLTIINKLQTIDLSGNCRLEILYPPDSLIGQSVKNLNNSSLVVKLVYNRTEFLFPGDIEEEIEKKLVADKIDLSVDVLKTGHQGSDTSTSQEFLDAVNPQMAVIQVGENDFGHPSRRVLNRLSRAEVKVYRTDWDGTIKMISDGREIKIETTNSGK